jgi:hypothetical protein
MDKELHKLVLKKLDESLKGVGSPHIDPIDLWDFATDFTYEGEAKSDIAAHLSRCEQCLRDFVEIRKQLQEPEPIDTKLPEVPENLDRAFYEEIVPAILGSALESVDVTSQKEGIRNQADISWRRLPTVMAEAGQEGPKALIFNTWREIHLEIVYGPFLTKEGEVSLDIKLDINSLPASIQEIYLDLISLRTIEIVETFSLPRQTEQSLRTKLPENPELTKKLEEMRSRGMDRIPLPKSAFSFRIWWPEG